MLDTVQSHIAIVPAAGVGSRMKADRPKQYLLIDGKAVLEHTVEKLLSHPNIAKVVVSVTEGDPYFPELAIASHPDVIRVAGGKERADSVLSGLNYVSAHFTSEWVLVHDAARPCVSLSDIDCLIDICVAHPTGGILASPVRDTMKRANSVQNIDHTVEREALWHALTPQMFKTQQLTRALADALQQGIAITDEASALEWLGETPALVQGDASNIKITQPEDLALAEFYLSRERGA
ncbi:2-C-methyl-D-erythritol 4-phosphate cytidylyltransferase [Vibrio sp. B1FLJ16]|uniref:2-C-methyl-D-erythritol 4-phosphate cytidylyltransferase n=1 Tax=Vibrio sp. B1FLJ16 TaxID=2751178 RepID=UPI0015F69FD2|nr:2-C-methyl-D-erythritol 4-phosphate cytidylyltransferase [Vibrio sp. B1FLJ16]CAD7812138.1 Catalyzes the formation of 4-diphosphocytidyl-2-C- methyl-D-erythritol from CTP and 2-C-methyl-D-erythritol 4- phosphate (MEP) [Vibrio sp. B1FLJ16]CAE6918085.1 Catalyzes the formation of 4-diphosphocytidyl-2-C- methyl-D-erythritol from CTP and 2-C-methyl-D-erythritol 4- phosphate (MEP) [Vibrio sp. B1FLJ16]